VVVLVRHSWRTFDFIQVKLLLPPYAPFWEQDGFSTAVLAVAGRHAGVRELGLTEMLPGAHGAASSWFRSAGKIFPVS